MKTNFKTIGIALVLCLSITLTACSAAWVSTATTIISVAGPALINILEIVAVANGQAVNQQTVAKVNSDVANIKQLLTAFASASSSAAPGVCSQLQAALTTYQADQQLILSVAQVSDPATQTKIQLLSGLVTGTVQAIFAVLPQCQAPASGKFGTISAPPVKVKNFVKTYNAILVAKTGNIAVDNLTSKRKLHEHSTTVRYASLGILN
jgi:hypothetical protein